MKILHRLVEGGNSVLLIEHNLEVIRESDYIVDIGPEAGKDGGKILAQGNPQEIIKNKKSTINLYDFFLTEYLIFDNFRQKKKSIPL